MPELRETVLALVEQRIGVAELDEWLARSSMSSCVDSR